MTNERSPLPASDDIARVVNEITSVLLRLPASAAGGADGDEETWTGRVLFDGAFRGAVTVACARRFAILAGSRMIDEPEASVDDATATDALAELTNVVGGNLKSLISERVGATCRLSVPTVSTGEAPPERAAERRVVSLACGGEILRVEVLELTEGRPAGGA